MVRGYINNYAIYPTAWDSEGDADPKKRATAYGERWTPRPLRREVLVEQGTPDARTQGHVEWQHLSCIDL